MNDKRMMIENGHKVPYHDFFELFDYAVLERYSVRRTWVFEDCEVLKDILHGQNLILKGQKFSTVWFYLEDQSFHFINWKDDSGPHDKVPDETSVEITQSQLMANVKD